MINLFAIVCCSISVGMAMSTKHWWKAAFFASLVAMNCHFIALHMA